MTALLDTSVLIARESGRPIDADAVPDDVAISVITVAELLAGVVAAATTPIRMARLATLDSVSPLEPLPVTVAAARWWAQLRAGLAADGRRAKANDLWIAAIARSNGMAVVTQDDDFDVIALVGGPDVIKLCAPAVDV